MLGKVAIYTCAPDGHKIDLLCSVCGKSIGSLGEKFAVGLHIVENGQQFSYLLGTDGPFCCGRVRLVPQEFETESEMVTASQELRRHFEQHQSTLGLQLVSLKATRIRN